MVLSDIDECLAGIAECFQECVNTHGSYECRCNQGYKSEGNNCSGNVFSLDWLIISL